LGTASFRGERSQKKFLLSRMGWWTSKHRDTRVMFSISGCKIFTSFERNGLSLMLSEIRDRENVIKTGSVLLTADEGGPEMNRADLIYG